MDVLSSFQYALMCMLQAMYHKHIDMGFRQICRLLLSFLFYVSLHASKSGATFVTAWKKRTMQLHGMDLQRFWSFSRQPCMVYALVHPHVQSPRTLHGQAFSKRAFYIGSTKVGLQIRQDVRWRKFRLLEQGDFTNTELVNHYLLTRQSPDD